MNDDSTQGRQPSPWTTHQSEVVYVNPWIEVTHRTVTAPTGAPGIYGVVSFQNLAIGIIPIDDEDHTWLVGQHRYPIDRYSWEIPEGGGPIGTNPIDAARRELQEECGLVAGSVELLIETALSNSVSDELGQIYVARDLRPTPASPDETEALALRRLPVSQAIDMVLNGEIDDSLSQIGLLRLAAVRSGR